MFVAVMAAVLSACSTNEVLRVGVPFADGLTEGIHFEKDVTDVSSIKRLRVILHNEKEMETLDSLTVEPQAFFTLDHPDGEEADVHRYVWYSESGSAILSNERGVMSLEEHQEFFRLTTKQTNDLKRILE
ncbi:hypothetical protein [Planococcus sp. ISL-109]|uniref:hypothetical protein n=1 Tax=Planococcus sp. ISL-109 TaxID=2819166 RepID=UPI001BE7D53A|nr:hypothetical protein [Planococcus sp. ISL-109]MBT2581246.1 hypothetical protein [Planococcus sp. ISL-109]